MLLSLTHCDEEGKECCRLLHPEPFVHTEAADDGHEHIRVRVVRVELDELVRGHIHRLLDFFLKVLNILLRRRIAPFAMKGNA